MIALIVAQGFSDLLAGFGRLGLLSVTPNPAFAAANAATSRRQFMETLVGGGHHATEEALAAAVVRLCRFVALVLPRCGVGSVTSRLSGW